jgi:hypothetical protein
VRAYGRYAAFDSVIADGTVIFLTATMKANSSTVDSPEPCDLDLSTT